MQVRYKVKSCQERADLWEKRAKEVCRCVTLSLLHRSEARKARPACEKGAQFEEVSLKMLRPSNGAILRQSGCP